MDVEPTTGGGGGGVLSSSMKTAETPDIKKRHRRIKSTSRNIDIGMDAGFISFISFQILIVSSVTNCKLMNQNYIQVTVK